MLSIAIYTSPHETIEIESVLGRPAMMFQPACGCYEEGKGGYAMASKNYYRLLGVSRTETGRGIQKAFRELTKHHHPERAGPQGMTLFQELLGAYETLMDPQCRRDYDAQLYQAESLAPRRPVALSHVEWPHPAPLMPQPMSIGRDFATVLPSWEALHARLQRNFLASLTVEVQLSPEEARRGGVLNIGVPVFRPCTLCAGTGRSWSWPCQACQAEGMIEDEDVVAVYIPPQVQQGAIMNVPLHWLGINNFYLRIFVRMTSSV
jgi:hypothetical protein